MPELAIGLPACRPELVARPLGEDGVHVVKDPSTGDYYHLGAEEHFLLTQLDGRRDGAAIRAAFLERFGKPLAEEELVEFLEMVTAQGLVQTAQARGSPPAGLGPPHRQSILYWRKNFFDPDRPFTWLAPRIGFFWTRGFLIVSAGCILLAVPIVLTNWHELAGNFTGALRWQTALWAWLVLLAVTALHESAHGLTCKHYGGEVHEVGFLLMFFMPCFYCNVSDAWLFKEKSKRLWVTLAGGYCDLCVWALAVFLWRMTLPGTLVNYLAWVVLSVVGVRVFFNFNPLLKLDGYYLLGDALEVPNLRQRALEHLTGHLRWLLWGAVRPAREPRGRVLLGFGVVSWLYSVVFLALVLWGLFHALVPRWGWLGLGVVALLGLLAARGVFKGFTAGEVRTMIARRLIRTVCWLLVLGGLAAALWLVEIEDRASGPFRVRPATRGELRAPVAGFLKVVYCDEGDRVSVGEIVARLELPDLDSRLTRKKAEVRETRARLRLLEIGPRPEEVAEQRRRVERARAWRDLAQQDLTRARQANEAELDRLEKQVAACRAELDFTQKSYHRSRLLAGRGALAEEQRHESEGRYRVSEARLAEAQAARRACQVKGALEAETELARRTRELADVQATLRLLEAGSRPEEIQAEKARLARLQEEVRHLEEQQHKQTVTAPVSGLVTTARLREKVGQYLREGDLIGVVEEPAGQEAELSLNEQDVPRVRVGQEVALKARGLPFETLATTVDRIAPAAGRGEAQGSVVVCCRLDSSPADLRPEMTGHARVYTGRRPIGAIVLDRVLRFVRTEFWW
jgi:multidrug efflux pump subunit AcrA (membrane-fusion protein)